MSALLSQQEIDGALVELRGWSGTTEGLHREATVSASDRQQFDAAWPAIADGMNHHPDISGTAETLVIDIVSHSDGGVTGKDVELAGKLQALLQDISQR